MLSKSRQKYNKKSTYQSQIVFPGQWAHKIHFLSLLLHAGERRVAEFVIDYLDSLSTVALAERQPQLQQPLYSSLLQVRQTPLQHGGRGVHLV